MASQRIWERYCRQLAHLAREKLDQLGRRAADEEDVALSAFHSFCQGAVAGRFPQLDDRHGLWRLLVTITARKALKQLRDARRQNRAVRTERQTGDRVRMALQRRVEWQRLCRCLVTWRRGLCSRRTPLPHPRHGHDFLRPRAGA